MKIQSTVRAVRPLTAADLFAATAPSPPANGADAPADPHEETRETIRKGLRLSFLVYDPLDHVAQELQEAGFTHIRALNHSLTGAQGLCCVRGGSAHIVFRGSASLMDWIMDFLFVPFFLPLCHFGFGTTWRSLRGQVRAWLQSLPEDTAQDILICGHSLGGGMAHLAAMDLAKDYHIGAVVTFGAPRACFLGTAKRYAAAAIKGRDERLGRVTYCVVNQRDIVAKVPPALLGYRDVGRLVYIGFDSKAHYGDDAEIARIKDSMMDMDVLFGLVEEEKIGIIGPHSPATKTAYDKTKTVLAWIGQAAPILKIVALPSLFYVLLSFYFLRSGFAHMGDKYMGAFMEALPAWHYEPYEKTGAQKAVSLGIRLLAGGVMAGLFLWGLTAIAAWSLSGLKGQW